MDGRSPAVGARTGRDVGPQLWEGRLSAVGPGRGGGRRPSAVVRRIDGRSSAAGPRACNAFLFLDFTLQARQDAQGFSSRLAGLDGCKRKQERGRFCAQFEQVLEDIADGEEQEAFSRVFANLIT